MFGKSYLEIQASKLDDLGLFGKGKARNSTLMLGIWFGLTCIMVKKLGEVDWLSEFHTVLEISLSLFNFDHHFDGLYLTNGWFFRDGPILINCSLWNSI